jgi:hypothetical protein
MMRLLLGVVFESGAGFNPGLRVGISSGCCSLSATAAARVTVE